jgi:hypothetical protein
MDQQLEQTASSGSTMLSKFDADLRHCDIKDNLKLFYGQYPHSIFLHGFAQSRHNDFYRVKNMFSSLKRALKKKFTEVNLATRNEEMGMRIYTNKLPEVLALIKSCNISYNDVPVMRFVTDIHIMDPATEAKLRQPVTDSFRTVNVICKQLPFKKYRYKIHWATHSRDKRKIGHEALTAIKLQLANIEQIRTTKGLLAELDRTYSSWHSTYFYAEDLDWVPMICLIDWRFIKKIERYQTQEELESEMTSNEQSID